MECLDTKKYLKINYEKNFTAVIVVEGADYEFKLLKRIFRDVLNYTYVQKSRNDNDFKEYNEFIKKSNANSRFIVINTKNSNIGSIEDDDDYRNELYKLLYNKYGLDIKNVPIYYVWDRDCGSNSKGVVEKLLRKLNNAYEDGLLLLSYPCCEAYPISLFENVNYLKGNIKEYIKNKKFISRITKNALLDGAAIMHKKFIKLGVKNYNLDKFDSTNLKLYKGEEEIYSNKKVYLLLSMISIILIDLGIIRERD